MKIKQTYIQFLAVLALAVVVSSCGRDRNNPGIQYAPEMYESIPLEPFTQVTDSIAPFKNGRNQQLPPEGTIARGQFAAFEFPNSEVDSVRHSDALKGMVNPVPRTEKTLAEGKELYLRFCGPCHGEKGAGDGKVSQHDAINPTAYNAGAIAEYTPGELYYVIMHGKGVMGSYASQLEYEDRWKVIHFVEGLQGKEMALEAPEFDLAYIDGHNIEVGTAYRLSSIYFGVESADFTEASMAQLNDVASFLKAHPGMKVQFEGHTDGDGEAEANLELSKGRAASVATWMASNGISEGRIMAEGFGESKPVAPNTSAANKAKNRRVEIKVTEKK